LRRNQAPGGGFAVAAGTPNAQSTAWAVQGLIAGGISPSAVRNGGSPLDYLTSVRAPDGHYRYSAASDQTPVWVTGQALVAARGKAFPLSPVAQRRSADKSAGADTADAASAGDTGSAGAVASGAAPASGTAAKPEKDPPGAEAPAAAPARKQTARPVSVAPVPASEGTGGDGAPVLLYILVGAAAATLGGTAWGVWRMHRRSPR
jgi:hypothetical protein